MHLQRSRERQRICFALGKAETAVYIQSIQFQGLATKEAINILIAANVYGVFCHTSNAVAQ
jgi:hypothetical protein